MSKANEDPVDQAKEAGKKILKGVTKGGILFSKRVSEGVVNAQMAQKEQTETLDKIMAAGSELGKAVVKGGIESAQKSAPEIIEGFNEVASAIQKKVKGDKE